MIYAVLLPVWGQVILGMGAVITALSVIWTKMVRPGAKLITNTEAMLPLLRDLTMAFEGTPHAFAVLDQVVAQFRTDSGSSLRDVVNRLDKAAEDNKQAAELLKVGVESSRLLAEQDRLQLQRLVILLDRLTIKEGAATESRARMEAAAEHVADDLAAAHARADSIKSGQSGDAADAASQQTPQEKSRTKRRQPPS